MVGDPIASTDRVGVERSIRSCTAGLKISTPTVGTMIDEGMDVLDDDPSSELIEINGADDPMDGSSSSVLPRKFQKESTFMKLLPYYEDLQGETDELLDKTIRNLTKVVLCHDFQVGGVLYTKCLWT
ncbi:Proteasome activator complex subunit 4 [Orchesella cincta]|uniref:Proteasome activator complex subunit 4 n=1 Tax=Orchesella cincta TaxID=48709 RepID=A0A1D2NKU4_ORCCI|nr:Proteasome activator complex subunit 4 [Orchesella cincta]